MNRERVIKISLSGSNISDDEIAELSKLLHDYEILHTSGLLLKEKELFYECYLNLSFSDTKSKDLKTSLDKIRNIFKEIKIAEISIKNNDRELL